MVKYCDKILILIIDSIDGTEAQTRTAYKHCGNNGISEMNGNNNCNDAKIKGSIDKVLEQEI